MQPENQNSNNFQIYGPHTALPENEVQQVPKSGRISKGLSLFIGGSAIASQLYLWLIVDHSAFLAGIEVIFIYILLICLYAINIVTGLIFITQNKHNDSLRRERRRVCLLILAVPVVMFVPLFIGNQVSSYLTDRETRSGSLSPDQQAAKRAEDANRDKTKLETAKKYGFYYYTTDRSEIIKGDMRIVKTNHSEDVVIWQLDLLTKNPGLITQSSFADRRAITRNKCYVIVTKEAAESCVATKLTFGGYPVLSNGSQFILTTGTQRIVFDAVSATEAQKIINHLKPVDNLSGPAALEATYLDNTLINNTSIKLEQ